LSKEYTAALAKVYRLQQTAEDNRKAIASRLHQVAPDLVAEMQSTQDRFGKFAASKIEIEGEVVYERGELLPVKFDKYMRGR
jgi:high-affinity K+ transport system ATPase subunit B